MNKCSDCGEKLNPGDVCRWETEGRFHVVCKEYPNEDVLHTFNDLERAKEFAIKTRQWIWESLLFKDQISTYFVLDSKTGKIYHLGGVGK